MMNGEGGSGRVTYLFRNDAYLVPHQARQDILQKRQVEVGFLDFELSVARVQREGERIGFAGFDGAGKEIEREELHCGERGILQRIMLIEEVSEVCCARTALFVLMFGGGDV